MSTTPDMLTGFTKGVINAERDSLLVLRDEPTVKLLTIEAQSKYYHSWVIQDTGEENQDTTVDIYLDATEDTLKLAPGKSQGAEPTVFTLVFKNPADFGMWRIFTESGRYSVMIGAIWQPGWDELADIQ